jgi:hypothetical protein
MADLMETSRLSAVGIGRSGPKRGHGAIAVTKGMIIERVISAAVRGMFTYMVPYLIRSVGR